MTGSSGATFTFNEDKTLITKHGNARVGEQGHWLSMRPHQHLPFVHEVSDNSYSMEVLLETNGSSHNQLLHETVIALSHLWNMKSAPLVALHPISHKQKLIRLCRGDLRKKLLTLFEYMPWDIVEIGAAHGDPTLENVMFRNECVVLIDPIPATPAVPDLRSVDTGKILQSILGYERCRYRRTRPKWNLTPRDLFDIAELNEVEWAATCYWAAVHLLRAIPYAPQSTHEGLVNLAYDAISLI